MYLTLLTSIYFLRRIHKKVNLMEKQLLNRINLFSRWMLGFVFIYHGIVPKIIWVSPIEVSHTNAHGLNAEYVLPIAGLLELLLGICIIFLKRSLVPIYIAGILLGILLIDVFILVPALLIETFNPLTLNLTLILFSIFICLTHKYTNVTQDFSK